VGVIELKTLFDIGEGMEFPAVEDDSVVAVVADEVGLVRDDDHGAVAAFFEEFVLAAFLEAVVAYGDDFVDEIAIELDDHGEGEGQPGAHAGGIRLDRLVDVASEFREVLHIGNFVFD